LPLGINFPNLDKKFPPEISIDMHSMINQALSLHGIAIRVQHECDIGSACVLRTIHELGLNTVHVKSGNKPITSKLSLNQH